MPDWMHRFVPRTVFAGLLVGISMCATGCFDRQELEQQAFVTAIGIDKAPGNTYDYTFRIALPQSQSTGGGGGGGGDAHKGSGPVTFRARSLTEAMTLANASIERLINMTHVSIVVFGEDAAKQGLDSQLQTLLRFREFRRTIYLRVSKGPARVCMSADKPSMESSMTRIADDVFELSRHVGLMPGVSHLHEFVSALEMPHMSPVLPVIAVNPSVESGQDEQKVSKPGVSYSAGQIRRSGGNPVEWIGTAVFHKDRLVGYLTGQETVYLRLVSGRLTSTRLDMPDPVQKNQTVGLSLHKAREPRYTVQLTNPVRITVNVPLEADLTSLAGGEDVTQAAVRTRLEAGLSKELARDMQEVMTKLFRQYGVDCVPVSRYIAPYFPTYQAFESFDWEKRLKRAQVQVCVDCKIRRFGVQSVPLRSS